MFESQKLRIKKFGLGLYLYILINSKFQAIRKFGEKIDDLNSNGVGLDFVMCLGDLNNAYPDDHDDEDGFKVSLNSHAVGCSL